MRPDDFALPDASEADYLLSGLARLIARRGAEAFLDCPILLPEPRFFPDPVPLRGGGVAVLLRRLLAYAEIEPQKLDIHIYSSAHVHEHGGHDAAGWFIDVSDGVYAFGVKEDELRDEMSLVGTLGHEVAHAYRTHHGLVVIDRETEEKLTDLTTIYLGFGVFSLESSYQYKTGSYDGAGRRLVYEQRARGYLLPGQLAFLLAAQLVARDADEELVHSIESALPKSHASALKLAMKRLAADGSTLLDTLRLPAQSERRPLPTSQALAALPPTQVEIHDQPALARSEHQRAERIAFRVKRHLAGLGTMVAGASGFAFAVCTEQRTWFWVLTLGAAFLGFKLGRKLTYARCSHCERRVDKAASQCHTCGARLVRDIDSIEERLEAEEEYRKALATRETEDAGPAQPEVRCPACGWRPLKSSRWACNCGHRWNTFETQGSCPSCERQWEYTDCLHCHARSDHARWYDESSSLKGEAER